MSSRDAQCSATLLLIKLHRTIVEPMFDMEVPPPPIAAPPEEVIDCLVEDRRGVAEPVRWSWNCAG